MARALAAFLLALLARALLGRKGIVLHVLSLRRTLSPEEEAIYEAALRILVRHWVHDMGYASEAEVRRQHAGGSYLVVAMRGGRAVTACGIVEKRVAGSLFAERHISAPLPAHAAEVGKMHNPSHNPWCFLGVLCLVWWIVVREGYDAVVAMTFRDFFSRLRHSRGWTRRLVRAFVDVRRAPGDFFSRTTRWGEVHYFVPTFITFKGVGLPRRIIRLCRALARIARRNTAGAAAPLQGQRELPRA